MEFRSARHASSYTRRPRKGKGCKTCHYWGGWMAYVVMPNGYERMVTDSTAFCLLHRVAQIDALGGCGQWEREPGADDD